MLDNAANRPMRTAPLMSTASAPRTHNSPWLAITREIVYVSPVDALLRFDAAIDDAARASDVAGEAALSANALGFMLFHWTRFDRWRQDIERFETALAHLPQSNQSMDSLPELTRLTGVLAAALLRGVALEALAPTGHRMELLMQGEADPTQLYLAAACVLPWFQMSRNAAAAQALHARMIAVDIDGAHYFRGAWLCMWAQHLLTTDHARFAEALQALDEFMRACPTLLLQFRHARLTTEKCILLQDMASAEIALAAMLAALHPNRPMERVIYNSVATLVVGRGGDSERVQLHGSHIARDLVAADCPPALASVYQMAEARAHLVTRRYALAAAGYAACIPNTHSTHAETYVGLAALAQALVLDRDELAVRDALRAHLSTGLSAMRRHARGNFFAVADDARGSICALALRENIETEYVRAALARFPTPPPQWADEHWPWALSVRTFGGFRAQGLIDEGRSASKASNRPLSLLKLIVAHGKQGVTVAHAADALWPAQDGDQAENALSVTLLRLRKMHATADLIERRDGWLHVDTAKVWTDVAALEAHLEVDVKALLDKDRVQHITRLFDLYRGDCLVGIEDDWAHARAAHFRGRVTLATQYLLQSALEANHADEAELVMTNAHARGLDTARLLNTVHPNLRASAAWTQLQQHLGLLGLG